MKFTRRKFLQLSAFVCAAPVIHKIDGIASVNIDSCVSGFDMPMERVFTSYIDPSVIEAVTNMLVSNGMAKGKSGHSGIILNDKMDMILMEGN